MGRLFLFLALGFLQVSFVSLVLIGKYLYNLWPHWPAQFAHVIAEAGIFLVFLGSTFQNALVPLQILPVPILKLI